MSVTMSVRPTWKSSARGKSYLTQRAAIRAEAVALIRSRHPSQQGQYDEYGRCEEPDFHWSELPRSDVLLRRVFRMVAKANGFNVRIKP